jgi:hypothetical protein
MSAGCRGVPAFVVTSLAARKTGDHCLLLCGNAGQTVSPNKYPKPGLDGS